MGLVRLDDAEGEHELRTEAGALASRASATGAPWAKAASRRSMGAVSALAHGAQHSSKWLRAGLVEVGFLPARCR
jgi:hypothetical protein